MHATALAQDYFAGPIDMRKSRITAYAPRYFAFAFVVLCIPTCDGEPVHVVDQVDEEEHQHGDPLAPRDVVVRPHRRPAVLGAVLAAPDARRRGPLDVGAVEVHVAKVVGSLGHEVLRRRVEGDRDDPGLVGQAALLPRHQLLRRHLVQQDPLPLDRLGVVRPAPALEDPQVRTRSADHFAGTVETTTAKGRKYLNG